MPNYDFGIPYMGSKRKLAFKILSTLPQAENLYDLFGGGFSVSHCAIKCFKRKFQNVYYNEIQSGVVDLVKKAINGDFNYDKFKPKFIEKDEFKKSNDMYIKVCWSFGNSQKTYLFGPDIINQKRSLHNALVFNQFDDFAKKFLGCEKFFVNDIHERRLLFNKVSIIKIGRADLEQLQNLERLQRLQRLQRLEQLQNLERLQRLESTINFSSSSYDQVEIKANSIVYCDPPYENTGSYGKQTFDSKRFFEWAKENKNPIYISEYNAPKDFKMIKVFAHKSTMSATNNSKKTYEKLFANKAGFELYKDNKLRPTLEKAE